MIAHLSYVMCDRCANPSEPLDNAKQAREVAAAHGWRMKRGRAGEDVCRACVIAEREAIETQNHHSPEEGAQ